MTLPVFPDPHLYSRCEIAFGADHTDPESWVWTDVTDKLLAVPVSIERGRQDEMDHVQPSKMSLTLDNVSGDFTPTHPLSQYYPNVQKGTPIRFYVDPPADTAAAVSDDFTRTVAAGATWGLSSSGSMWTNSGDAEDHTYSVSGGVGVVSSPAAAGLFSWNLTEGSYRDLEASFTVSPRQVTTGGGYIAASFLSSARFEVRFGLSGQMSAAVVIGVTSTSTILGTTYAANDFFRVRVQIDGSTKRIKVWPDGDPEPGAWSHTRIDPSLAWSPVGLGLERTFVSTNDPGVLHYDDFSLSPRDPRFFGYIAEWVPSWRYGDVTTGTAESSVEIVASGVLRRMGQGQEVLQSAARRLADHDVVVIARGYWPMEDGAEATSFAPAALPTGAEGQNAMSFTSTVEPSVDGGFYASLPLPRFGDAGVSWVDIADTVAGDLVISFFVHVPSNGIDNDVVLLNFLTPASDIAQWTIRYQTGGDIILRGYDASFTEIYTSPPIAADLNGNFALIAIHLENLGGDLGISAMAISQEGVVATFSDTETLTDFGWVTTVYLGDGAADLGGTSMGQLIVGSSAFLFDQDLLTRMITAHRGETALARIMRIASEENLEIQVLGDPSDTPAMGPQRINSLLGILWNCAETDGGVLYEPLGPGLGYRTRRDMYTSYQPYVLDAAAGGIGEIAHPFEPVFDDEDLVNDVTATRMSGGETQVVGEDSVATSGRYTTSIEVNVENDGLLPDVAQWVLMLGTWPGMRYPRVTPALEQRPSIIGGWRNLRLGDLIEVKNLPPQHPPGPVQLLVQGYTEQISPYRWTATVNATPGEPWQSGVISGDALPDKTYSRIGTSSSTLAVAIDDTDTSLSVTDDAGYLWITTALHPTLFPFYITVGGERMQVTAASGVSSPQTLTVVRGVDGVTWAHDIGAPVRVAPTATVSR